MALAGLPASQELYHEMESFHISTWFSTGQKLPSGPEALHEARAGFEVVVLPDTFETCMCVSYGQHIFCHQGGRLF